MIFHAHCEVGGKDRKLDRVWGKPCKASSKVLVAWLSKQKINVIDCPLAPLSSSSNRWEGRGYSCPTCCMGRRALSNAMTFCSVNTAVLRYFDIVVGHHFHELLIVSMTSTSKFAILKKNTVIFCFERLILNAQPNFPVQLQDNCGAQTDWHICFWG